MRLELRQIHDVRGIYTVNGAKDRLPDRMSRLAPDAAASFEAELKPHVVVSDMWRSAESSLQAVEEGRGAARPGWSGHNFGLSIDVALEATVQPIWKSKRAFDVWMAERGWFCWRDDHKLEREAWHYNFFGVGAKVAYVHGNCVGELGRTLVQRFGDDFEPNDRNAQRMLADLKLYRGEIDGEVGPLTRQAILAFQRAWHLDATGAFDLRTLRTLAFVSATIVVT